MVINEYRAERRQGDFLIRAIRGADAESGAIAVGDEVEVGQAVQFHVRDADSADEDLRRTLKQEAAALGGRPAAEAKGFTFIGLDSHLFAVPNIEPGNFAKSLDEILVAVF